MGKKDQTPLDKLKTTYGLIQMYSSKDKKKTVVLPEVLLAKNEELIIDLVFNPFALSGEDPDRIIIEIETIYGEEVYEGYKHYNIPLTHIVICDNKSYFITNIKISDKRQVNLGFNKMKLLSIFKYFIKTVLHISTKVKVLGKLDKMPVPYSKQIIKDNKGIHGKEIELQMIDEEAIITYSGLQNMLLYYKDQIKINRDEEMFIRKYGSNVIDKLKDIPIEDTFTSLSIETSETRSVEKNIINGLQTYGNREINYISTVYKPLTNLPRGPLICFLYYVFDENAVKLKSFLVHILGSEDVNKSRNLTISGKDFSLEFTEGGTKIVNNTKDMARKILFRNQMLPMGFGFMRKYDGEFPLREVEKTILFEINGDIEPIQVCETRNVFNRKYKNKCFFFGGDNDLGNFYYLINEYDKLKKYNCIDKNGFFGKNVVLGGKFILNDGKDDAMLFPAYQYKLADGLQQLPYKEYFKRFKKLYVGHTSIPLILQAIALAGMNLREENEIYPGLLLSGGTGQGKSSITNLIKGMLGYGFNSRKRALPGITPQPLQIDACDNSILFLEELTKKVGAKQEEIIKDFINRDEGGRGFLGANVRYDYSSPIFVIGERVFKDESLNNRFVGLGIDKSYRGGTAEQGTKIIKDLKGYTSYLSIYEKYLEIGKKKLNKTYEKYRSLLTKDLEPRYADVWAYTYTINELFEFGITYAELLGYTKKSLKMMGFLKERKEIEGISSIGNFLIKGILSRKMVLSLEEEGSTMDYSFIFIDDEFFEKNKLRYKMTVEKAGSKYEGIVDKVYFTEEGLIIRIETVNATATDVALKKIVDRVSTVTRAKRF